MRARVIANGTVMGTYEGSDEDDILEVYAEDMGYESYQGMLDELNEDGSDTVVQECAIPELTAEQLGAILAACGANNEITDYHDYVRIESMETEDNGTVDVDRVVDPDEVMAQAEDIIQTGWAPKLD